MLRWRQRIRKNIYIITDIINISIATILAILAYRFVYGTVWVNSKLEVVGFITVLAILILFFFWTTNVYNDTIESQGQMTVKTTIKFYISLLFAQLLSYLFLTFLNLEVTLMFYIYLTVAIILTFVATRIWLIHALFAQQAEAQGSKNILVIGQSERGIDYINEIKKHGYLNLNIIGYVHIKQPHSYPHVRHVGGIDEIDMIMKRFVVDEVAIARSFDYDERIAPMIRRCQDMGVTINMLLDIKNEVHAKVLVSMVGNIPMIKFHTVSLNEDQLFAKRCLDVIGGIIGLIPFAIAYLIFGPLIKLESPGPVIFKQDRVGKNGRIFKVFKFRSMGVDAEAKKQQLLASNEMQGHMFKMENDPRVTKIGAFIRKTSIDELPQFVNVLRGEMSLVGTRPPTVDEVKGYKNHHHKRISIMPGITGLWQVSGRSEIKDFEEVVKLDATYIEEWSVWYDIKILFKTLWVVLRRKGSQ